MYHSFLETPNPLQKAGLDDFCTEIKVLNQLVYDAARATIVSGRLVSTAKKAALSSHATKLKTTAGMSISY